LVTRKIQNAKNKKKKCVKNGRNALPEICSILGIIKL
jgi:hypothetical protein